MPAKEPPHQFRTDVTAFENRLGWSIGSDRAALDAAILLEIDHGGWCPRGRRAEDGPIEPHYQLQETTESGYAVRTEKNVVESDGTLVFCRGPLTGGTHLTVRLAHNHRRPLLILDLSQEQTEEQASEKIRIWIAENRIHCMNVAGPRESTAKGIGRHVKAILISACSRS
ncbi:MAG: putative molybdenum carrier protein [Planctomycetota bacterium]|nr:putative molybdenum carrier protein [Planctomycetota bacterium]